MNLNKITWTDDLVEEWLETAAKVDRAMPTVKAAGYMSYSIMIVRTEAEILQSCTDDKQRFKPVPEQITIWEEVTLRWLNLIDSAENKKIVWLHVCGMGWGRIGKKFGLSRQTTANRYKRTIEELTLRLQNNV